MITRVSTTGRVVLKPPLQFCTKPYLALGTAASATIARIVSAQMIINISRPTPIPIPGTKAIEGVQASERESTIVKIDIVNLDSNTH